MMLRRILFRQYYRIYRYDIWMRRHFSMTGHVLLILMIAAGVFGVDTRASATYQFFVLLAVIFLLSLTGSLVNRLRVTVDRNVPRYSTAGERLTYAVTVTNLADRSYDNLALLEHLAETPPGFDDIQNYSRGKPGRLVSYRRWRQVLVDRRGGVIKEVQLPCLRRQPLQVKISFTPLRRGILRFDGCHIAKPDPLGLLRRLIFIAKPQTCMVLPRRYPLRSLNLPGHRQYQPGGVTLANSVGDSTEFMSLRDYRCGDPLNTIHWKSYAKYRKLIVKEFQDEYFIRRALVLDTFLKDSGCERFEAAVSVAASIAMSERQNDSLLDLMFAGAEVHCFTSGRGIDHLPHLQEILATVQANRNGSFMQLQQAVMQRAEQCSSVVCVLLQWDNARRRLIEQLDSAGIPTAVFLIHDGSSNDAEAPTPRRRFHLVDYRRIAEDLAAV